MKLSELIEKLQGFQIPGTDPEVHGFDIMYECYRAQKILDVTSDTDDITINLGEYKED